MTETQPVQVENGGREWDARARAGCLGPSRPRLLLRDGPSRPPHCGALSYQTGSLSHLPRRLTKRLSDRKRPTRGKRYRNGVSRKKIEA